MALSDNTILSTNVGSGAGMIGMGMFNQGMSGIDTAIGSYRDRIKNTRINELLKSQPTEGENADSYNARMRLGLSGVDGINPLEALQLTNIASKPIYDREAREVTAANRLFDEGIDNTKLAQTHEQNMATQQYRADTLQETKDYHRATEGDFAGFTDEYGKTWMINKNTGERKEINSGIGAGNMPFGGAGGKNIIMVDKTVPDGFGGSTKVKVPVDKRTGLDAEGNQPQVVKRAAFAQKDKDWSKTYGQGNTVVNAVRGTLPKTGETESGPSIWGGYDTAVQGLGAFFGTKAGKAGSLLNQDLENLRLEATNKLTGVLSNQDMQIILDTIPTASDQPSVARKKLAKVEKSMAQADANQFNRLVKSNPNAVKDMAIGMVNGTTPVPPGYQLVQYDDGSVSLIPK